MATITHNGTCYLFNAPRYFLTKADIGKKFVRTAPYEPDSKWMWIDINPTESEINQCALELRDIQPQYLEFTYVFWGEKKVVKLKVGEKENWNDGSWITVEKCVTLFAENPSMCVQMTLPGSGETVEPRQAAKSQAEPYPLEPVQAELYPLEPVQFTPLGTPISLTESH